MTTIDPTTRGSAGAGFGQTGAEVGENSLEKEQFLKLLVAQMSQQDPMSPQDSDQYVQQLTQFSTVEQLMNLNQGVTNISVGQLSANSQSALRFVGREVLAVGDEIQLDGMNQPAVDFMVPDPDIREVEATVYDNSGEVVFTQSVPVAADGRGHFVWSGRDEDGNRAPEGDYHVSFKAESETEGKEVTVDTFVRGTVTGVRFDQGYPELLVGEKRLLLSDVIEVSGQ